MPRRRPDEAGDSLIEIVIALVIIGVVIGAFVSTFSTGATASTAHRTLVTTDAVLRNYAEQTKAAARGCTPTPGATFTIGYPSPPGIPAGFSVSSSLPSPATCPAPAAVQALTLTVTAPNGVTRSMSIDVRTP